jgi:hypothetical protein
MPCPRALGWVVGLALLMGCRSPEPLCQGVACQPGQVTNDVYPYNLSNKVDILFVVDSSTRGPLAGALTGYLPQFMAPLERLSPPANLRVGVITADMGAGGALAQGRFLLIDQCWEGYKEKNFTGTLGEAFGEYAAVPATGSARVQPLASLRAALAGSEGFLRPDAYLLVVVIAGQDDCSGPTDLDPPTPYGCYAHPAELTPIEEFVTSVKGLKPADPRLVYISVVAGPPEPVVVGADADGNPALEPSCTGGLAQGTPGIRLARFISQFDDDRGSYVSLCGDDLAGAVDKAFGSQLNTMLSGQCLAAPPSDEEPEIDGLQPEVAVEACSWVDWEAGLEECQVLPACDPVVCAPTTADHGECSMVQHDVPAGTLGCWYLWRDEPACPPVDTYSSINEQHRVGSGYRFRVDWGGSATCLEPLPPPGTYVYVQYASCGANPAAGFYDCSPGCASYWPRCCPTATPGCFP